MNKNLNWADIDDSTVDLEKTLNLLSLMNEQLYTLNQLKFSYDRNPSWITEDEFISQAMHSLPCLTTLSDFINDLVYNHDKFLKQYVDNYIDNNYK